MNRSGRNVLMAAGIISTILGATFGIPSIVNKMYAIATVSSILMIGGLILFVIALGD